MPTDPAPTVEACPADAAPHPRVTCTGRRRLMRADHWSATAAALPVWLRAVVTGFVVAFVTIAFRWLVQAVEWLATGQTSELAQAARTLAPWQRLAVCSIGALLAGLALHWGNRWAARGPRGDVHVDYIDAARAGHVDLNDRTNLARSVSALLSIGTGASIGREGLMVQVSAWAASTLPRLFKAPPEQRRILLVCGIAAGIAATYRAPVAGVVFVLELALGFFARHAVAPVLIAAGTASGLTWMVVDARPLYSVAPLQMKPASLLFAIAASVLFGGVGWAFLRLMELSRRAFAHVRPLPLRMGLGGLLVGAVSAFVPEVWGNGYGLVASTLQGVDAWQWLALVLVAKIAATSFSSGSGAIGGVFTPALFVGAAGGGVLARVAALELPAAWVGDARVLVVIGMAAVLTSTTQAPLMAITIVLEMTDQFQLTVPVMLACAVAYAVSTRFGTRTLYGNPIEAGSAGPGN
jgi:CIC family chloride channel protein